MALSQGVEDLLLEVGIDVNDDSFKDFKRDIEDAMKSTEKVVGKSAPRIAGTFKKAMSGVGKAVGGAVVGLGKAAAVGVGLVGTAVAGVGVHMLNFGDEYNRAMNQLQASTGATEEEMKSLGETAKNVYAHNFGESIEDVANSMAVVQKAIKVTGKELEKATESGIALRDTFGFEMEESTRAVSSLMKQFGVSAEKAYEIIAKGAQEGANQNDDLLDTLNEYSNHYAQLGLSADEFLTSLTTASEQGVFSIDKVGDAVKEFGIRAQDGSKASMEAFETLGFNAEKMTKKFASGSDTAKQAMFEVVEALESMEDPTKKNAAAVGLFGTMYEDLGPKILPILSSMKDKTIDTTDALKEINKVKYNDIGSAIEGIKRSLEVSLLPVASAVANELTGIAQEFSGLLEDGFQPEDIEKLSELLMEKILGFAEKLKEYGPSLISTISETLQTVVQAIATLLPTLLPILAQGAMDLISGLLQTIVENTEPLVNTVVEVVTMLADFIVQNLPLVVDAAVKIVIALAEGLAGSVETLIPSIILAITTIVSTLIDNLPALIQAAFTLIEGLGDGLIAALPVLIEQLPAIIIAITDFIADNLPELVHMGFEVINALIEGLLGAQDQLLGSMDDILLSLLYATGGIVTGMVKVGGEIVAGIWKGIKAKGAWIENKVKGFFSGITKSVKGILGIHSPSKVYAEIGGFMGAGIGVGFDDTMDSVSKEMEKRVPTDFDISTNISEVSQRKVITSYTGVAEDTVQGMKRQKDKERSTRSKSDIHVHIDKVFGDKQGVRRFAKDFKEMLEELGTETGEVFA